MATDEPSGFFYLNDDSNNAPYWKKLGQFIESFALVEDELNKLLAFYSNVTPSIARALFSGTRAEAAMAYIRRIMAVEETPDFRKKDLDDIFPQLTAIKEIRNLLVHYQSSGEGDDRTVTNQARALIIERARKHRISADTLTAICLDLYQIANRINFHRHGKNPWAVNSSHSRYVLTAAWRYKPPQNRPAKAKPRKRWDRRGPRAQPDQP